MREVSFIPLSAEGSLFSNARAFQGFLSQQTSPSFGSQPSVTDYPSTLLRCSSAPDLYPQARVHCSTCIPQDPMTDPADVRRRSHLPTFDSGHSFQNVSTYQNQQDSSSLPGIQPPVFPRYLEIGSSLYNTPSRYHESPHGFIDPIPTVDPLVLHRIPNNRQGSWGDSGIQSNYDSTGWMAAAGVRDQNYRCQMAYESDNQAEYREGYQFPTVSNVLFKFCLALLY